MNYFNKKLLGRYYSDWERTDQGGGKMPSYMEDKKEKCEIDVETRTIQTFYSSLEYKYESWQDNTIVSDTLFESDYHILNIDIEFKLQYNKESREAIRKIRNDLIEQGKKKNLM